MPYMWASWIRTFSIHLVVGSRNWINMDLPICSYGLCFWSDNIRILFEDQTEEGKNV